MKKSLWYMKKKVIVNMVNSNPVAAAVANGGENEPNMVKDEVTGEMVTKS